MKTSLLLFLLLVISITIPVNSFAQIPINCHFGDDSTSLDDIFEKDIAVKTFIQKYPDAIKLVAIQKSTPLDGELSFTIGNNPQKEVLLIKFNQNENGCYRPYQYHYSFSDGLNDVTIKNTILDFTEIINLIKLDDKKVEDFYTKNCNPISLDYVLKGDSKPYFCKSDVSNSIEMSLQKHVGGIMEIHIPNKIMGALFYNCYPYEDFFVLSSGEEIDFELIVDEDTRIFKVDLLSGYNKVEIFGLSYFNDSDGFCGSIWGSDSKYLSPLLQTKIGVESWQVQCNDDLTLLLKPTESTPVCVTGDTAHKLIQRHWSIVVSRGES